MNSGFMLREMAKNFSNMVEEGISNLSKNAHGRLQDGLQRTVWARCRIEAQRLLAADGADYRRPSLWGPLADTLYERV